MELKNKLICNFTKIEYLPPHNSWKQDANKVFQTYCVKLEYVDDIDQIKSSDNYHIQAMIFDEKYKKFVGSCWKGKPSMLKNKKISFNLKFYFYTAIPGKELILVTELIKDSEYNKTVGWMCLPLIESDDSKSTLEHSVSYKVPLLHGSPLALLVLHKDTKGFKLSDHTTGMEISLSLMPYPLILQTAHLVPENVLIDASDSIPGLITDPFEIISNTGYIYKPHLQKCITFILEGLCIRIQPSVEDAEKTFLEKFIKQQQETAGSINAEVPNAQIIQRRLQVGVHNGYCFIKESDLYHLLVEPIVTPKAQKTHLRSSSMGSLNYSRENGLTLRSDVKIPNVPDDPNITFVFLVEYLISLPNAMSNQTNTISKSPTSNIAVAWGYVKLGNLRTNPSHTVPLISDSSASPFQLLFLRTPNEFELSFTAFPLTKQNKNMSVNHTAGEYSSVASFSTKTYISPETSYFHSPATSVSAVKHKSVGDIPTSVTLQNDTGYSISKNTHHGYEQVENSMNLQEVTLVSSLLPLVPPMLNSFPMESSSSFQTFTKFYWDKLQPVLDHYGKPASVLDNSLPFSFNKELELSSPPQQNECMIHFLAVSDFEESSLIPSDIFFTFQFYRFLPVRTESLMLKSLSDTEDQSTSALVFALHKFRDSEKTPGFQVIYNVDPSELSPGEYRPFVHYLIKHNLHIDLWNAQSLLYFGTVLLPLKYFCRQGKDGISVTLELDIINCEFPDESLTQSSLSSTTRKGKLHLHLANIRHPLTAKCLEKLQSELNSETVIVLPKMEKNKSRLSAPIVSKVRPIIETNQELTHLLASRCIVHDSQKSIYLSEERRRKLARMEAVRNSENENVKLMDDNLHHFLKEREQDLLTIESYIHKNKSEMIQALLHASVTCERSIYPVIGNKVFFEFVLENPFQEPKRISISWKCPELSIVTDLKMWQMLKNVHDVPRKIAFADGNIDILLMQPKEKIHIPFTYCSSTLQSTQLEVFKTLSGHYFKSDMLSSALVSSNLISSTVKVRFTTEDDQTLLAVLILHIQPLPPSPTHIFKFLSMEHSVFNKCIRLNSEYSFKNRKLSICCSDAEAVCSIQEPQQDWEEDISIHVKAPTRAAGKLKEFYLFLYKDAYQVCTFQTWRITICPLQRIDLSNISGQLTRSSLLIRGSHATNLVRCFSSSSDLQLHPSEPFVLSPFAVQELSINVRSLLPGTKHFQITLVNQVVDLVLQSWLLVLSVQKPTVSRAFQVHLSIGKEATKRITYTNPYKQDRRFILHLSHPHLLRLRENAFCVSAGQSYCLGLYFLPQEQIFTETLFLYLNDEGEKNEETYCIKVICQ